MIPRLTQLVNDRCLMVPLLTTDEVCDKITEFVSFDSTAERTILSILRWAEHELSKAQEPEKVTPLRARAAGFEEFWRAYPRKQAKKVAFSSWVMAKGKPPLDKILSAVELQRESDQWKQGYIPMPSTWLNQGRWDDEVLSSSQFDYTTGAQ
jgi:hypothetical protein